MTEAELLERVAARIRVSAEDLYVVSRAAAPGVAEQAMVRALLRIEAQNKALTAILERLVAAAEAHATVPAPPLPPAQPSPVVVAEPEAKPAKRGR